MTDGGSRSNRSAGGGASARARRGPVRSRRGAGRRGGSAPARTPSSRLAHGRRCRPHPALYSPIAVLRIKCTWWREDDLTVHASRTVGEPLPGPNERAAPVSAHVAPTHNRHRNTGRSTVAAARTAPRGADRDVDPVEVQAEPLPEPVQHLVDEADVVPARGAHAGLGGVVRRARRAGGATGGVAVVVAPGVPSGPPCGYRGGGGGAKMPPLTAAGRTGSRAWQRGRRWLTQGSFPLSSDLTLSYYRVESCMVRAEGIYLDKTEGKRPGSVAGRTGPGGRSAGRRRPGRGWSRARSSPASSRSSPPRSARSRVPGPGSRQSPPARPRRRRGSRRLRRPSAAGQGG